MSNEIPMMAMAVGVIIPLAVFVWLYFEEKGKRDTMLEIAKHIDDPRQLEQLVSIFKEKKEPIDYRRGGVSAILVGLGILLGYCSLGSLFEGVGALVGLIGAGTMIAGYLYPKPARKSPTPSKNLSESRRMFSTKLLSSLPEGLGVVTFFWSSFHCTAPNSTTSSILGCPLLSAMSRSCREKFHHQQMDARMSRRLATSP